MTKQAKQKDFTVRLDQTITDIEPSEPMAMTQPIDEKDVSLDDLASTVRNFDEEARQHAGRATALAIVIGQTLQIAKKKVVHGKWSEWLECYCRLNERTARAYMQLAKSMPLMDESKRQRVANLPLREAIKAISTNQYITQKHPCIPRIAGSTEREKSCSIFSNAINSLKVFHSIVEKASDVKGSDAVALRKKLTSALAELDRLESVDRRVA